MCTHFKNATDTFLINQYRNKRDNSAFEHIFNRYSHLVFSVSMKFVNDEMLAEDITLEVFEKLMIYTNILEIQNLKSWLYVVAKHKCYDAIAKTKEVQLNENKHQPYAIEENNEERDIIIEFLKDFLKKIKKEQQMCIELFYFKGLEYKKIEEITGLSYMKIKSALQNGKRNLRLLFEKTPGFRYELVQSVFR